MKNRFVSALSLTAAIPALAFASADAQSPRAAAEDDFVSVTGTVTSVEEDSFQLSYGTNEIEVEFDDLFSDVDADEQLSTGEAVTVYGYADDDWFEGRVIDAETVYVRDRSTVYGQDQGTVAYYYFEPTEDTAPLNETYVSLEGTIESINGREFTLMHGGAEISVDTASLSANPFDDEGGQRLGQGDTVMVMGTLDDSLFDENELSADMIYEISYDGGQTRDAMRTGDASSSRDMGDAANASAQEASYTGDMAREGTTTASADASRREGDRQQNAAMDESEATRTADRSTRPGSMQTDSGDSEMQATQTAANTSDEAMTDDTEADEGADTTTETATAQASATSEEDNSADDLNAQQVAQAEQAQQQREAEQQSRESRQRTQTAANRTDDVDPTFPAEAERRPQAGDSAFMTDEFDAIDDNGDGVISEQEYVTGAADVPNITEQEARRFFAVIARDDNQITPAEFVRPSEEIKDLADRITDPEN